MSQLSNKLNFKSTKKSNFKQNSNLKSEVFSFTRATGASDPSVDALDPYLYELLDMLSIKRRHDTQTEKLFCKEYMTGITTNSGNIPLKRLSSPSGEVLAYYLNVSDDPILWSSHVDSVHSGAGRVPVSFDAFLNLAYVTDEVCPLGADDAAGMWIMFQMIRAGIGGTYIFHKGEEVGGIGSRGVAQHHKEFLSKFKAAIAFDRKDNTSVITHQGMGRCCSDEFANSFANALNLSGLSYKLDDTGVFTDTANYVDHIGECTNISCGYMFEHTQKEYLDVEHLIKLKDAVINAFKNGFDNIKFSRKPGEVDLDEHFDNSWYTKYSSFDFKDSPKSVNTEAKNKVTKTDSKGNLRFDSDFDYSREFSPEVQDAYFGYYSSDPIEYELSKSFVNTDEFSEYNREINMTIDDLNLLTKEGLEDFILDSEPIFVANVIKKLLFQAGHCK